MRERRREAPPDLGPRFEWIATLGQGGHGTVELALDRERGARVALKFLSQRRGGPQLLKDEFRVLRDVTSRNLVAMLELVIEPALECLVLEYVDGTDLLSHVRGASPPTETREVTVDGAEDDARARCEALPEGSASIAQPFTELVDALAYLERAGLVHGDLKPENILVERGTGRVVVLDFGIARLAKVAPHRPIGTPIYMAPEQFVEGLLTPATDRYALGVLLHRALTGRFPFVGTAQQLAEAKRSAPPPIGDDAMSTLVRALLAPDPLARPSLDEVRRALGSTQSIDVTHARVERTGLVGREREEQALVDAASLGRPSAVLLVGAPGLGKTTLLDALERRLGDRVLRSRCYSNESVKWNAIDGLVDALVAEGASIEPRDGALARLFPIIRRPDVALPPLELTLVEVMRRAARELALALGRSSRVVVVDDLQWADADARAFLAELARAAPSVPLVFATRGSDGAAGASERWVRGLGRELRKIELEPLSPEETQTLCERVLPGRAVDLAEVCALTGGVPFLIEELCRGLERHDASRFDKDAVATIGAGRLAELDDPHARRLLSLLAVNDGPVELPLLAHVFGERLHPMVRGLLVERWCRTDRAVEGGGGRGATRVDVYHDHLRQRLLGGLDDAAREVAHKTLAEAALTTTPEDHDALARHLLGARDARAFHYARRASDDARKVFAFDRAVGWLRVAERQPGLGAAARRALQLEIADCFRLGGRHADAATLLDDLATATEGEGALDLRRRAAEQWLTAGELVRGIRDMRALARDYRLTGLETPRVGLGLLTERVRLAVRGLEPRRAPGLSDGEKRRAALHGDIAWTLSGCLSLVDPVRSALIHTRSVHTALESGATPQLLRSLLGEVLYGGMFANLRRSHMEVLLRRVDELAATLDAHALALASSARGAAAVQAARFAEGVPHLSNALAALEHHPDTAGWELLTARHFHLHGLYYLGRFQTLRDWVEDEYRASIALSNQHRRSDVSLNHAVIGALLSHGVDEARRRAEDAGRFWCDVGATVQPYYLAVSRSLIALWVGELEAAWRVAADPGVLKPHILGIEGIRVDALHILGRAAVARAVASREPAHLAVAIALHAALAAELSPHAWPLAAMQLSGLARAFGRVSTSRHLAGLAAPLLERQGLRGFAAAARALEGLVVDEGALSTLDVGHERTLLRVLAPGAQPE